MTFVAWEASHNIRFSNLTTEQYDRIVELAIELTEEENKEIKESEDDF